MTDDELKAFSDKCVAEEMNEFVEFWKNNVIRWANHLSKMAQTPKNLIFLFIKFTSEA